MEQLANLPLWAQILSLGSFMFINGMIGGGHPFVNLIILASFGLLDKKLGKIFLISAIIIGLGELIFRGLSLFATEFAGYGKEETIRDSIRTIGVINGLLSILAFTWIWKISQNLFPVFGTRALWLVIPAYILGFCLAILLLQKTWGFVTTIIGAIMLIFLFHLY